MTSFLLHTLFRLLFVYNTVTVLYIFILSFSGEFFYHKKKFNNVSSVSSKRIAILVPAYKEDNIIQSTANSFLDLDYPKELYDVYIIADSFQSETLEKLHKLPLYSFEVSLKKSTKTGSLNEAFKRINKSYDIALICDADNILAKDFLKKLNNYFSNGARAIQGNRVAKNLDSSFAILDACSEGINNHIFRKGGNAIGLSSPLTGSGMAFDFSLVKNILSEITAVVGYDKILQLKVVQQRIPIHYIDDALIFDEKVGSPFAFKQQRKRWVSSQFIYLKQFFIPGFQQLLKGNISYFNLAVITNLILPRVLLFIMLPLLALWGFFFQPVWGIIGICLWLLYIISLLLALPVVLINKHLLYAILKLPNAMAIMIGTLFHLKKANKTITHTIHTKTEVSNTLFHNHGK